MSVTSNLATGKAKGSKARIVEEKTGGYKAEEKSEEQDERLRELLGDLRRVAAVEGTEEAENRQRAVKQQLLAAPSSSSSTGPTSRTLTPVATVERDREAMRVAFEEGGEVSEGPKRTTSMDMTAAQFRLVAARERYKIELKHRRCSRSLWTRWPKRFETHGIFSNTVTKEKDGVWRR